MKYRSILFIIGLAIFFSRSPIHGQMLGEGGENRNMFIQLYGSLIDLPHLTPLESWDERTSEFGLEFGKRVVKNLYAGLSIGYRNSTWGFGGLISEVYHQETIPEFDWLLRDMNFMSTFFPVSIFCSYAVLNSNYFSLHLRGGATWMLGHIKTIEDKYSAEPRQVTDPETDIYSYGYSATTNASISKFGAHLAVEFEIKLSSNFSITASLLQRFITIGPVTGTKDWQETIWSQKGVLEDNSGSSANQTLWYYKYEDETSTGQKRVYDSVEFADNPPSWATEASSLEPRLNRMALMFGLRLKFN